MWERAGLGVVSVGEIADESFEVLGYLEGSIVGKGEDYIVRTVAAIGEDGIPEVCFKGFKLGGRRGTHAVSKTQQRSV